MSSEEQSRTREDDKGGRKEEASMSGDVEETDPDLLRNTLSNIRRLEDEIEQFEGRHKYLAHTTSPSDGGDVRWYFCKVPLSLNQLAASIPRAEVVGKGEYFRFGMRDSLAIEASFLQREEELLSQWWKEYAECSEGPRRRSSSSSQTESPLICQKSEVFILEEERVGVLLRVACMRYQLSFIPDLIGKFIHVSGRLSYSLAVSALGYSLRHFDTFYTG